MMKAFVHLSRNKVPVIGWRLLLHKIPSEDTGHSSFPSLGPCASVFGNKVCRSIKPQSQIWVLTLGDRWSLYPSVAPIIRGWLVAVPMNASASYMALCELPFGGEEGMLAASRIVPHPAGILTKREEYLDECLPISQKTWSLTITLAITFHSLQGFQSNFAV